MRFKILPGTALFDKLQELKERMRLANEATKAFVTDLGFEQWYQPTDSIAGGLDAVLYDKDHPRPSTWTTGGYPKKSLKANAEIIDKIKALPMVSQWDLNAILSYNRQTVRAENSNRIAFSPNFNIKDEYVLIGISDAAPNYKPVADMVEITVSEFNNMWEKV